MQNNFNDAWTHEKCLHERIIIAQYIMCYSEWDIKRTHKTYTYFKQTTHLTHINNHKQTYYKANKGGWNDHTNLMI